MGENLCVLLVEGLRLPTIARTRVGGLCGPGGFVNDGKPLSVFMMHWQFKLGFYRILRDRDANRESSGKHNKMQACWSLMQDLTVVYMLNDTKSCASMNPPLETSKLRTNRSS